MSNVYPPHYCPPYPYTFPAQPATVFPKQTPTMIGFERMYSDGSGVEYGVTYDARRGYGNEIAIKRIHEIDWPADEIDWLISTLTEIRRTIRDTQNGDGGRRDG